MRKTKKQIWLTTYEKLMAVERPSSIGKIDWSTAIYLFTTRVSPEDAVIKTKKMYEV